MMDVILGITAAIIGLILLATMFLGGLLLLAVIANAILDITRWVRGTVWRLK